MGCSQSHESAGGRRVVNPLVGASPLTPWTPPEGSRASIEGAIAFLKDRGVYADDLYWQQKLFGYLRIPAAAPLGERVKFALQRKTLLALYSLVINGETHFHEIPDDLRLDLTLFPGFSLPAPYSTLDAIVIRTSQSKRCATNAAALVQLGSINRTLLARDAHALLRHEMTDVAAYWKTAPVARIKAHVFCAGEAQGSDELLRSFLQPGSVVISVGHAQCEQCLASFGFGLIARAKIFDDLHDGDGITHFTGAPRGRCVDVVGKTRL